MCLSDRGWGKSRADHRIQNILDVGTVCVPLPIIIRAHLENVRQPLLGHISAKNGTLLESPLAALGGALTQY
jgi:hypothetical protein